MTTKQKGKVGDFLAVFHEERLLQLGAAFLAAHSGGALLKSVIDDLLMPLIFVVVGGENWEEGAIPLGNGVIFRWGPLLSQAIHFGFAMLVIMVVFHHIKKYSK